MRSAYGMRDAAADGPVRGVQLDFVDVTPAPVFARLERLDDRVGDFVEVRGRVLVGGAVAATHVTAGHAEPKVHPRAAHAQAVLAPIGAGGDFADLVKVTADFHR